MHEGGILIALTGGGTGGHVTPHFALLPELARRGHHAFYVGSKGIESELVPAQGIPFHRIASGKLRRYFSLENFLDVFKVAFGTLQALWILGRKRPSVVFSKGGFVAVPVAVAAWCLRIPVVSHESDLTPGLATRIIKRFAKRILYTFPETGKHLGTGARHVGTPIREELFHGDRDKGLAFTGFASENVPTLLVMGGSTGAQKINQALLEILPELVKRMRVIHLTGKGKGIPFEHPRYRAFEYVGDELKDLFALTDFVLARAGANSIFEFLALRKPMLLIPLEAGSRGDQILNAESFEHQGWAMTLREGKLTSDSLLASLQELERRAEDLRRAQATFEGRDAVCRIVDEIEAAARR